MVQSGRPKALKQSGDDLVSVHVLVQEEVEYAKSAGVLPIDLYTFIWLIDLFWMPHLLSVLLEHQSHKTLNFPNLDLHTNINFTQTLIATNLKSGLNTIIMLLRE